MDHLKIVIMNGYSVGFISLSLFLSLSLSLSVCVFCVREGRDEMFYLTTLSTHLRIRDVGYIVKDHSDNGGYPLLPYRLFSN